MAKKSNVTLEQDFDRKLEGLREVLLSAQMSLDIWAALSDRTDERAAAMSLYNAFFFNVILALRDVFILKLAIATDKTYKTQPSFNQVVEVGEENPGLFKRKVDWRSTVQNIDGHRGLIGRIQRTRHTRVAHMDVTAGPVPVEHGTASRLLQELHDLYNEIHGAARGSRWAFTPIDRPIEQTTSLLELLGRYQRYSLEHPGEDPFA